MPTIQTKPDIVKRFLRVGWPLFQGVVKALRARKDQERWSADDYSCRATGGFSDKEKGKERSSGF
jgi:hypothetical protein